MRMPRAARPIPIDSSVTGKSLAMYLKDAVQSPFAELLSGATSAGVCIEITHRRIEVLHGGDAPHADSAHRPAFVACAGEFAVAANFAAWNCLAKASTAVVFPRPGQLDSAFGAISVLSIGIHGVPQMIVHCDKLRSLQGADVVVPVGFLLRVDVGCHVTKTADLTSRQRFWAPAFRGVDVLAPPLFARHRQVVQVPCASSWRRLCRAHTSSNRSV